MIRILRHLGYEGPRHIGQILASPPPVDVVCTRYEAISCPVHGACRCQAGASAAGIETCPLHSPWSSHAVEHSFWAAGS